MGAPQHSDNPARRTVFGILVALTIVAAALRFYGLNSELWYDEIKTVLDSVRPPLGSILTVFPSNNDHKLYSVLAHLSVGLFGEAPWSLRLPSALFAVATIPMLYVFSKQSAGRLEALLAAALLAVSYHHVWYAQSARGYTMLLFFTLATSFLLIKALKTPSARTYALYAAMAALGCYTHLTMVYVIFSQGMIAGASILFSQEEKFALKPFYLPAFGFVLAGLITIFLYLPLFADVATFFEEKKVEPAKQVATTGWAIAETLRGLNVGFAGIGGGVIAAALLAVGLISYLRQSLTLSALFVLPAPVIVAAAVLLQRPMFPRFFFVLAGFALIVAVRGAFVIGRQIAKIAPPPRFLGAPENGWGVFITLVLVAVSIAALPAQYALPKQNFTGAIAYLEREAAPGEKIFLIGGSSGMPLVDYYGKKWPVLFEPPEIERAASAPSFVVFTFADYIRLRRPDVWTAINQRCAPGASFPGTVTGSDVVVMKCGGGNLK